MKQLAAIALGGALGALLRYWVSTWVYQAFGRDFPWGTLAVNITGSVVMGALIGVVSARSIGEAWMGSFLLVGLLGAFTTFSTFSMETVSLLESGHHVRALGNVTGSVLVCVFGCWAGLLVGRHFAGVPG